MTMKGFGEFRQDEKEEKSTEIDDHFPIDSRFESEPNIKKKITDLGYTLIETEKDGDYRVYDITKDEKKVGELVLWLTKGKPVEALIELV